MNTEQWVIIQEFPAYEVSTLGRVRGGNADESRRNAAV
jgi:hypothetical protein